MKRLEKIAVIGGGAFGSALSCIAARAGNDTMLFLRDEAVRDTINQSHTNPARLGEITLPNSIVATTNPDDLASAEIVLFAVPAQQTRGIAAQLETAFPAARKIIASAKGLESESGRFQHQLLSAAFPDKQVLALSGPSFAKDIAQKLPTALTIAAEDMASAERAAKILSSPSFRLYSSDDRVGVETGGALKNVLAIAVGAVRGMGLGASAEAALIARGFAELKRLGMAMGAKEETLSGLSGLGDLVLTCSSPQSRNFSCGLALGRGDPLSGIPLAEGVHTAGIAAEIARRHHIEAPVIATVAAVLEQKLSPKEAVDVLLARPLKSETG